MTEEELYNRYHEIQSIYVGCYDLYTSEISEIIEIPDYSSNSDKGDCILWISKL